MLVDRSLVAADQGNVPPQHVSEEIENDWFDCVRFLQARPFGRTLFREAVTSLTLVSSALTPAGSMLIITTTAHSEDRVIELRSGKAVLI